MGFRVDPTVYQLKFEDPQLKGLEVEAESLSVHDFLKMQELSDEAGTSAQAAGQLLDGFAQNLVRWNLEDSHGPVPATVDGVRGQKMDFVLMLIREWMNAIAGVDPTSQPGLNGGGTSQELSIPMELS
jgi:hypothetical protein